MRMLLVTLFVKFRFRMERGMSGGCHRGMWGRSATGHWEEGAKGMSVGILLNGFLSPTPGSGGDCRLCSSPDIRFIFRMTWFCPNNTCFRGRVCRSIVSLFPLPEVLVVKMGTNLSADEINCLIHNGVKLKGVRKDAFCATVVPAAIDRRVNVEIFSKKIRALNVSFHFSTRNRRPVHLWSMLSAQHLKRIRSSKEEHMRRVTYHSILTGNGFGQQILVGCH